MSNDYVYDILDEIALEGLDGITVEVLWLRLMARKDFSLKIDKNTKIFIWNTITCIKSLNFYQIPQPRESIKYFDYSVEENSQNAALELDEIYPYHSIKNVPGIYGSCQNYFERVDVTNLVIKMDIKEVEEKYGNTLVIVASQELRNSALLGHFCTPNIDFSKTPIYYDLLEKIGRCRNLGVATHGKGSIQSIIEDSKSIFHYLKFLLQQKLVKKQFLPKGFQLISNTSKVYLTRFFEKSLDNNLTILQIAIKELKKRPNCMMPCDEFYALFESKQKVKLKKLKKTLVFKKFITLTSILPYRQFFPNASQAEWERKSKNGERMVRCYKLNQQDLDFSDLNEKDCEIDDDDESFSGFVTKGVYFKNMSIAAQAYYHIKNSGAAGLTHIELAKIMGLNKKCVEGIIKRLCSDKLCQFFIENDGRRRSKRYIVGENMKTKAAACEIIEILGQNQEPKTSENNENLESTSDLKSTSSFNLPQLQEQNIPYRTLKRIALIIKLIKNHRFRMFNQIVKHIKDEELNEGLITTVDRLTVKRILLNLEKDGLIKTIKINENNKINHPIKLYTDPTFQPDEKFAETLYQIHSTSSNETSQIPKDLENEFAKTMVSNTIEVKKMLEGIVQRSDKSNQDNNKGSELIYSPKFIRLNILHDFLFHLIYDYTAVEKVEQDELIDKLSKTINIDEELRKEMPKLNEAQVSTYMFVPPLNNSEKMKGWFLISDLLIRMPLSVFVKILRINEPTKEMSKYIHHPIRKHFLIKDLPFSIREVLLGRKNQISSLCFDLKRLCYMGLLQFGLKFGREHYQTFVYLNRKASLLDTTTSPEEYFQVPENMTFETKSYYFKTKNDVKRYWMELFNICMATNLGVKAKAEGKDVVIERDTCKEALKKLTESKTVAQVAEDDNGTLPGDHRGAAGLDSVMFSFLKSNWRSPIYKPGERMKEKKPFKVYFQKIKRELLKKRLHVKKTRRKKAFLGSEKISSASEEKQKTGELRKRKLLKERKSSQKKRKVMPFDDMDLEALKLMNTLRVTWSTAEDNLLLICRVAMMFLCPNIRTFVRIPWAEVRKVLQANLPESCNKTQKAIARRIIYMMKNPTTVRSVDLCLQELKEMPEAVEKFDCSELLSNFKPSAPNLPELQEELHDKFHKLVLFLQNRIVSKTNINLQNTDKELIPDSLEEFIKKFQLEVKLISSISLKSIRENVIRAVFMSSLSCRADKTSSAVQLFDIYRQYDDDELQSAIKKLHVDKVITVKKKNKNSIFRNENFLPLSFAPYTLSFAFQHLLSMKYSHNVYSESFYQISKLLQIEDTHEEEVDLNECNIALFLLASRNYCTFTITMPDQIIAIDSANLPNAAYTKILQRYCNLLKFSNLNSKVICSSGKIITKDEEDKKPEVSLSKKRTLSPSESVDVKKPKLDKELVKEASNKGKNVNKLKNTKNKDDKEKESDQNFIDKEQLCNDKTTRSSRIILYMMREEAKKDVAQEGIVMQEFFVVNASKVSVKVDKDYLELYSKQNAPKFADEFIKNIINRSLVPMNLVDEDEVLTKMKDFYDLKKMKIILDFIHSKKEYGTTIKELKSYFDSSILSSILNDFVKLKIIIKSGINETRYISQKFCAPWVLSSFKMTRLEREKMKPNEITAVALKKFETQNEKLSSKKQKNIIFSQELKTDSCPSLASSSEFNNKVKIIIRPWMRIDGSLNRKVLDRLLGTILSLIMTNPGISIKTIMDKFSPSLTPVWTKDLVEILFDIGCVTFTSVFVEKESTLFSKAVVRVSESFTGLEEDDFVKVEAKVDALLNLGLFIGKKSYSKDFLE